MPTIAETDPVENLGDMHISLQEPNSWTDDIPVCHLSGVGFSTNQLYRIDGFRREEHAFEDRSFHFRDDEDTYFYGVFDGNAGAKAADFASQRMPAEILLDQLKGKETDKEIKTVLRQAFREVERGFFESIDDLLAEKENLRLQLQSLTTYEALKRYPDECKRLNSITLEIESSTTAVVALIYKNKLYVANVGVATSGLFLLSNLATLDVFITNLFASYLANSPLFTQSLRGDSRALLYQKDKYGMEKIYQLSIDHDFCNEDELLRISQLGLNVDKIHESTKFDQQHTRCIGNYKVKGGYKEFNYLSEATEEPVIAEPDISGGIEIDESCKFLLLMSDGLYKSLEQATGTDDANNIVVHMLIEQFSEQSTLNGVAQAVVDKIVRIHHDAFMKGSDTSKQCQRRDDITLLVRNFNYPLPHAHNSPSGLGCYPKVPSGEPSLPRSRLILTGKPDRTPDTNTSSKELLILEKNPGETHHDSLNNRSVSITGGSDCDPQPLFQSTHSFSLDKDGKIKPYVDFTELQIALEEACAAKLVPEDWCMSFKD